ncbi:MAG: hypothetical protein P4L83_10305 [Nevskia sp.]|nr:hypothetical protein [Nevskia sp.]
MAALLWSVAPVVAADSTGDGGYELGKGWQVPRTDLYLGGYASSDLGKEESQPWSLDVSHLSLFLWWQGDSRFRFFSETDLENAVTVQPRRTSSDGAYLALERLYADWTQSDAVNIRVGKFLTPVGRWNLIHAAPLVWTTSRPLITDTPFPTNATGAMLYGTLTGIGAGLDYSVYGSIGRELRPDPHLDTFNEAYGAHLSYPFLRSLQVGLSFVNFDQVHEPGERQNLVGVDACWSQGGYELSTELGWRFSYDGSKFDAKGGFVQGVAPVGGRFYAVGRYEYFHQPGDEPGVSLWLVGLDYRWSHALILKTEFSKAVDNRLQVPEGFLASVAVLF